jgi:hypothetical protein
MPLMSLRWNWVNAEQLKKRGNKLAICHKAPTCHHIHKDSTRPTQVELDAFKVRLYFVRDPDVVQGTMF